MMFVLMIIMIKYIWYLGKLLPLTAPLGKIGRKKTKSQFDSIKVILNDIYGFLKINSEVKLLNQRVYFEQHISRLCLLKSCICLFPGGSVPLSVMFPFLLNHLKIM